MRQQPNHETPPPKFAPAEKSGYDGFVRQLAAVWLLEPPILQERIRQLTQLYAPANVQETFYLNQLAAAQLEFERHGRLQSGLFSVFMQEAVDAGFGYSEDFHEALQPDTDLNGEQRRNVALAIGFIKVAQKRDVLAFFNRLNVQAERRLRHAQKQFDDIRRQALIQPATPAVEPSSTPTSTLPLSTPTQTSKPNQSPQLVPAKKPPSASTGPIRLPGKRNRPG